MGFDPMSTGCTGTCLWTLPRDVHQSLYAGDVSTWACEIQTLARRWLTLCHNISSSSSDAASSCTHHDQTLSDCPWGVVPFSLSDTTVKACQVHESTQSTSMSTVTLKSTVVLIPCISSGRTARINFQARRAKAFAKSTWWYLRSCQNPGAASDCERCLDSPCRPI